MLAPVLAPADEGLEGKVRRGLLLWTRHRVGLLGSIAELLIGVGNYIVSNVLVDAIVKISGEDAMVAWPEPEVAPPRVGRVEVRRCTKHNAGVESDLSNVGKSFRDAFVRHLHFVPSIMLY